MFKSKCFSLNLVNGVRNLLQPLISILFVEFAEYFEVSIWFMNHILTKFNFILCA